MLLREELREKRVTFLATSALEWTDSKAKKACTDTREGKSCDIFFLPDSKKWNWLTKFPQLYRWLRSKCLEPIVSAATEDCGALRIALVVHKAGVFEPMLAFAGFLLSSKVIEEQDLCILLLNVNGLKLKDIERVCARHGVPISLIADSAKEPSHIPKDRELVRFFS